MHCLVKQGYSGNCPPKGSVKGEITLCYRMCSLCLLLCVYMERAVYVVTNMEIESLVTL